MPTSRQGAIRLFRFSGIDVFLHWSWFVMAMIEVNGRGWGTYSSRTWNIAEYLCVFAIVTLHEFGHSLACRQVGGRANQIILWPLGGVAYVDPPPRPGATLWSIAAGPLVNVALIPILFLLTKLSASVGWVTALPNLDALVNAVFDIDIALLFFNILPIYPLDGGQILRALLWFRLGRARSLMVATILGFVGFAGFIVLAIVRQSSWLAILGVFILMNCWGGFQHARALLRLAKLPRREGYACPACKASPPVGDNWKCAQCGTLFDTFQTRGVCPACNGLYPVTRCMECGEARPISEWAAPVVSVSSTFANEVRG